MGRESRILDIAWELKNLWNHLTRKELSDYYNVSERTLYTYAKKLDLPKKIDKSTTGVDDKKQNVCIWLYNSNMNKYKKLIFKNWNNFVFWTKAQCYPITIDTLTKNGNTYITCKHGTNKIKEALEYEKQLCTQLK